MAVPLVLIPTVTSAKVAPDNVAVTVTDDPAFSAIEVALTVNVTLGADSLSVIVMVTACVPSSEAEPPLTPSIEIVAVSFEAASYKLSSVGVKSTAPVVDPAEIVISSILPEPSV